MDKIISTLKKRTLVIVVFVISFVIWLALCEAHYDSYWGGTIFRVQTVDLNILHHALPPTISQLILQGRTDALQKVLDSNYGLFGLIVTDASGNTVLYKTQAEYKGKSWYQSVDLDYLRKTKEPYDLLLDPPPTQAQYIHKSPRHGEATATGEQLKGRVIGRLYYVRGVPPTFQNDLSHSVGTSWFELTGSKRGYIILTMAIIGFAVSFIFLVLWRKKDLELKAKELQLVENELSIRRKALDHLNMDLLAQKQRREWLEHEAEFAYKRALKLKESLEKLKEVFFLIDMSPDKVIEFENKSAVNVRAPLNPASQLISEIESLLPDLTNNAKILRSQAEVLQSYCTQLEIRQAEMQEVIDKQQKQFKPSNLSSNLYS
jgi:hypothetical protein